MIIHSRYAGCCGGSCCCCCCGGGGCCIGTYGGGAGKCPVAGVAGVSSLPYGTWDAVEVTATTVVLVAYCKTEGI